MGRFQLIIVLSTGEWERVGKKKHNGDALPLRWRRREARVKRNGTDGGEGQDIRSRQAGGKLLVR